MKHDGVSVITMIVLSLFVIERVKAGILFASSWEERFRDQAISEDEHKRLKSQRRKKLVEFLITGALVLVVLLAYPEISILQPLGINAGRVFDFALTWLVLTAGSDRLGDLLKGGGESVRAQPREVKITGDLRLESERGPVEVPRVTPVVGGQR